MLRGVRSGRNDVFLSDKTKKGRQVVADYMNEWHCTGFSFCQNTSEYNIDTGNSGSNRKFIECENIIF